MLVCEYCAIPGYYGEKIHETEYWTVYLAPSQRYLGTCVVALKRKCSDLKELNQSEWADFGKTVEVMENSLNKLFSPDLFNWSCFKNSAFRSENPQPEVHWHFIPRYRNPVEFQEILFEDPDFGYIPQPIEKKITPKVRDKLIDLIKKNLNESLDEG